MPSTPARTPDKPATPRPTDRPTALLSAGALAAFVAVSLVWPDRSAAAISTGFSWSARWFGAGWQLLLLATWVVAVLLALTPWASARLGTIAPQFPRFQWVAMIMCTLLAGGGVFWAAAEPMYHYTSTPPLFAGSGLDAAHVALAQSFTDWGFLAWAILGSLGAIVLLYAHERGMPLRPRSLLFPVLGHRANGRVVGTAVDVVCIVAVVAGTVGPLGFLGLQVAYGLDHLGLAPNSYPVQLGVIVTLALVALVSVLTGLDRGIQVLSRVNVWVALALAAAVVALGSVGFVLRAWLGGLAVYATHFVPMATFTADQAWSASWTVFFYAWFLGYGPLMSIFIARISRGRSIRDLVVNTAIVPPLVTTLWFSALGGTGIWIETGEPGAISEPLAEGGLPASVVAIADHLPAGTALVVAFLLLTMTFVATTTDSMSYAVAQACTRHGMPSPLFRGLWVVLMATAAAVLISLGGGGISALQSFIVITAVPVGFILLPSVVAAPVFARRLHAEQRALAAAGEAD